MKQHDDVVFGIIHCVDGHDAKNLVAHILIAGSRDVVLASGCTLEHPSFFIPVMHATVLKVRECRICARARKMDVAFDLLSGSWFYRIPSICTPLCERDKVCDKKEGKDGGGDSGNAADAEKQPSDRFLHLLVPNVAGDAAQTGAQRLFVLASTCLVGRLSVLLFDEHKLVPLVLQRQPTDLRDADQKLVGGHS